MKIVRSGESFTFLYGIARRRMAANCYIGDPNRHDPLSIEFKRLNCGSPNRGQADYCLLIRRPDEVFGPGLLARVKKWDFLTGYRVGRIDLAALLPVAMKAGQRQVIQLVGSAELWGVNVVDGKQDVLPLFRRMAILADTTSALSNSAANGVG
jgi:hypothetical protein